VWSAINMGTHEPGDEGYGGMAGTSQAAPHVAGAVALVASARKALGLQALTPAEMTKLLTDTARPFPARPDKAIGAGIVDARAAVLKAIGEDSPPPEVPGESVVDLTNGAQVTLSAYQGDSKLYRIRVPANARSLSLRTLGGSGNVGMYVKVGAAPSVDGGDATYKSTKPGSSQAVMSNVPVAGDWYVRVRGASDINGVTVLASYTMP
jgi:serine protease